MQLSLMLIVCQGSNRMRGYHRGLTLIPTVKHILPNVCLRLSQSSLFFKQYMGLCAFSLPISVMLIVRIRVLYLIIIIRSGVWPICHYLGLGHEILACAVCLYLIIIIRSGVWPIFHYLGLGHEIMVCAVCLIYVLTKILYTKLVKTSGQIPINHWLQHWHKVCGNLLAPSEWL